MSIQLVNLQIKGERIYTKHSITGRAYPLNEIKCSKTIFQLQERTERIKLIYRIVNYLDVENSRRYLSDSDKSFCNIYVYDVIHLLGAYLPRVWWKNEYIELVQNNIVIEPIYNVNVEEMNTEMLYDWLESYGGMFNWRLQESYFRFKAQINNLGTVGVICAKSKNKAKSNHICMVLPDVFSKSKYWGFLFPSIKLSEAGKRNREIYFTKWWNESEFYYKFYYLDLATSP